MPVCSPQPPSALMPTASQKSLERQSGWDTSVLRAMDDLQNRRLLRAPFIEEVPPDHSDNGKSSADPPVLQRKSVTGLVEEDAAPDSDGASSIDEEGILPNERRESYA